MNITKDKLNNIKLDDINNQHISNQVLITKVFVDLIEVEEIISKKTEINFGIWFDNLNINEIVAKSTLISKHIIYHDKYQFKHIDFKYLNNNYTTEEVKAFVFELYANHFKTDFLELLSGLKEIVRFYRRIESKKKKINIELRKCIIEICYCIQTIKEFFYNEDFSYLKLRELSLHDFYFNFRKLMSRSRWRVLFINLSAQKIINVSDHLQILKTKREQNFILWSILGAIIGLFVKELLVNIFNFIIILFK